MVLKVGNENYWECRFTTVYRLFQMGPRKCLFQIIQLHEFHFLIFFRRNSEHYSYNYLGDTLKDYLMLLQVTININILSTMYFYRIVEILTELFIYNEVKILEEQSMTNHLVINTLKCKSLRHQSTKRCMAPVW